RRDVGSEVKQWYCDTCGEVIKEAKDGWLEWLFDENHKAYDFHIVHHFTKSPLVEEGGRKSCYQHDGKSRVADNHLDQVLEDGLVRMLVFLDPGPHVRDYKGPEVRNVREWVELTRRLFVPLYEEARRHWDAAEADGFFEGHSGVSIYMRSTMERLIK